LRARRRRGKPSSVRGLGKTGAAVFLLAKPGRGRPLPFLPPVLCARLQTRRPNDLGSLRETHFSVLPYLEFVRHAAVSPRCSACRGGSSPRSASGSGATCEPAAGAVSQSSSC
jgi:hypothetical protein